MARDRDHDELLFLQGKSYKVVSTISGKGGTGWNRLSVARITLSSNSVLESAAVNTTVGSLSISGAYTGTPTYTLMDSAGGKFVLAGALLKTNALLDYETANIHSIIVAVSGVTPPVTTQIFNISVLDVFEAPPPAAPTLALTSANTDTTPDFTLAGDIAVGDTVRFQYSTSAGFAGASELTNTIDAGEDAANLITFTTGALALGTWYFRARIERPVSGNSGWSNTVTDTIIAGSYVGPGNVVAGATTWIGLRAYTTAYATGSNPALDLHNNTTGAFVATINILASGSLDVATAATVIAGGASRVGKMYDQTGNGHHFTQATNSQRPVLTLNGLGSLPVLTFNTSTLSRATGLFSNGNSTLSTVANSTNSGSQQSLVFSAGRQIGYNNSGANTMFMYAGSVLTAPATDAAWHAIQGAFGNPTSTFSVDGTNTTGDAGVSIGAAVDVMVGTSDGTSGQPFMGKIAEMGYWDTPAFSGAQCTSMSANQHTYWGF